MSRRRSLFKPDESDVAKASGYPPNYSVKVSEEVKKWKDAYKQYKNEYKVLKENKGKHIAPDFEMLDQEYKDFLNAAPDYKRFKEKAKEFHEKLLVANEMQDCLEEYCRQRELTLQWRVETIEKQLQAKLNKKL